MVDLRRACGTIAEEYLSAFRIMILNGPRRSGKTTLPRHMRDRHGGILLTLDDEQTVAIERKAADTVTSDDFRGLAVLHAFSAPSSSTALSYTPDGKEPFASATAWYPRR